MRIENRLLFITFWDDEHDAGVYALLIGWAGNSLTRPVVAYNYGLHEVPGAFEVWTDLEVASIAAQSLRGPVQ